MTLKKRMLLITTGGLVISLLVYSLLIYVFFVRQSTDAEVRMLWNRAQTVLRKPEVRDPAFWSEPRLLDEFLSDHMMIRITGPDGTIRTGARNDESLSVLKPVYRKSYLTRISARGADRYVSILVPVLKLPGKEQVGTLELAKGFSLFRGYLKALALTLSAGFAVGSVFSIVIGLLYVRWVYRPVAALARTMERIEAVGGFERLKDPLAEGDDEFGRLGQTFNRMMDRLEDHFERQRHFVQDASHELRTPLTVITSYAGMLKRWGGQDPAVREEAAEAIEEEAKRLRIMVDGLLRLAQDERVPQERLVKLDLWRLVRRTARELSGTFGRKVVTEGDRSAHEAVIEGDPFKLKQLLIILLDNAIKYSSGAVAVRVKAERDGAVIEVEDRGIGIAEEHLGKLFDRFYRADQARARQTGGSGLGLAIARKIAEDHEGSIGVRSRLGEGSVFSVRLPYIQSR